MTNPEFAVKKKLTIFLLFAFCISTTACIQTMYHWGEYEDSIYKMDIGASVEEQKEALLMIQTTIEEAEGGGGKVPPGVYAHYGYLMLKQGKNKEAKELFIKEKEHFPESAYFMDSLVKLIEKEN